MLNDLRGAFSFLTILPLGTHPERKPGWSFTWYPVVGWAIGLTLALVAWLSPLSDAGTAFLVLAIWGVLTGGLHLDGFGDSCDGLFAATTPTRRLEIMKDPRTGTWAVVGLIFLLLGKWIALRELPPAELVVAPVLARWVTVAVVYRFPYARTDGTGAHFRDGLGPLQVIGASLFAIPALQAAPIMLMIGLLAVFLFGFWANRRLGGGITGDVYGAMTELAELACLVVLAFL